MGIERHGDRRHRAGTSGIERHRDRTASSGIERHRAASTMGHRLAIAKLSVESKRHATHTDLAISPHPISFDLARCRRLIPLNVNGEQTGLRVPHHQGIGPTLSGIKLSLITPEHFKACTRRFLSDEAVVNVSPHAGRRAAKNVEPKRRPPTKKALADSERDLIPGFGAECEVRTSGGIDGSCSGSQYKGLVTFRKDHPI
jgi:hypothetical protein